MNATKVGRKERARLMPGTPAPSSDAPKTRDQPLFGLWKDREDISDPASWVRQLRLARRVPAQANSGKEPRLRKSN